MTKSKAKTINSDNTAKTTKLAVTAMLAALSAVLMFFEFPLGFIAPSFYEFDFSEVPVLVGTFSMGPIAGVVIEFVKILVKFLIKGTSTQPETVPVRMERLIVRVLLYNIIAEY